MIFRKTTKIAEWDAYESGYKGENWADEAEKITKLGTLGITKPTASKENDEINQGFFCVDNAEKKLYTDMETIEFGPTSSSRGTSAGGGHISSMPGFH